MKTCIKEGCDKPVRVKARGLCASCYQSWRRFGIDYLVAREPRWCEIAGCQIKHYALGLCESHWMKNRAHGTPTPVHQLKPFAKCSVEGCEHRADARTYCRAHWMRWRIKGDPGPGELQRYKPLGIPGYSHSRKTLNVIRGKASDNVCEVCGKTATGWDLREGSETHAEDQGQYEGYVYSTKPWDYLAHCKKHRNGRSGRGWLE
jgi:hypothetical protein